ncbi:MAG TPA: hypothetical protein DIT54_07450 [Lachnospiraceae bacterium]|nr:hypothetical protein [Lachnospiraceae bacterium]
MTIKEVSEKYGITQDTLRYYERVGMIPPVTRTSSGIRNYNKNDLAWVQQSINMRNFLDRFDVQEVLKNNRLTSTQIIEDVFSLL